jgi:hypothetical protein
MKMCLCFLDLSSDCVTLIQEVSTTVYGVSTAFCEKWLPETHTQSHILFELSKVWYSLESLYIIVLIDASILKV